MKRIYNMELGDQLDISYWKITRVPGGWLFAINDNAGGNVIEFVGFDNEFQ
jgi:hypothetical protein